MNLVEAGASVVCLPDQDDHVEAGTGECFTAGWGDTTTDSNQFQLAENLISMAVQIYSPEECVTQGRVHTTFLRNFGFAFIKFRYVFRFWENFRKLSTKNTTKLENSSDRYGFLTI